MTMKENQTAVVFDSESFGRESDALTLGSKETHELNDSRIDAIPILFEAKDRDMISNCKVMDDLSADNENGAIDSPTKEGENGLSHHLSSWDKDADSLSSDSYDMDKEQRSPEHEDSATVAEFEDCNGSDGASDLIGMDANMFTDKNVLECDVPELEVCYRDIDCQILKDICVDEGRPEKDINVIESFKEEKSGHLFPQPPNDNDHFESTEESSIEHTDSLDQCGSREEIDQKTLVSQGSLESSVDNLFEKDTTKHCNPESLGEAETGSPEEGSNVVRQLPMEDFSEANEVMQPPNQILNEQAVSESHDASLEESGETGEEDVQDSSLLYKSKVESGTITFNFNSSTPVVVGNGIAENVEEQSSNSRDIPNDVDTVNLSDVNVQEQPLVNENCDASYGLCVRSEDTNGENAHDHQSPEHKDATKSDDFTAQIPTNKSQSSTNDVQVIEPNVPVHERRNSGNVSIVNQLQHDEGETSFSAASLITYSGPIAFSGSLSHRSDGSTTSAKSFAFPILQSEWNSSPVRMAKADRRHFRKHKGWRSGLLCCRF